MVQRFKKEKYIGLVVVVSVAVSTITGIISTVVVSVVVFLSLDIIGDRATITVTVSVRLIYTKNWAGPLIE